MSTEKNEQDSLFPKNYTERIELFRGREELLSILSTVQRLRRLDVLDFKGLKREAWLLTQDFSNLESTFETVKDNLEYANQEIERLYETVANLESKLAEFQTPEQKESDRLDDMDFTYCSFDGTYFFINDSPFIIIYFR